jgi:formylglycine-generating enzyme required for sulfatase activity
MGNNPSDFENCGDNCPVENVSWDDVQKFIRRLNKITSKNYRLPTEAEWEYAARSGGKNEKWASISNISELGEYAWYDRNSNKTHPVGQKKPNNLGIFDMSGNVWEWVFDWYDKNYYKNSPRDNPQGPAGGKVTFAHGWEHVVRGGSWEYNKGDFLRCANRDRSHPDNRDSGLGFRCARDSE